MIFDTDGNIWIRQSWLDTAMRCAERGRLATVAPEWDSMDSDSALIGTGAHYGIEQSINLGVYGEIGEIAHNWIMAYDREIKWTKYRTLAELADQSAQCAIAWRDGIMPHVDLEGATTEVPFRMVIFTLPDGRTVGITGTIDLVGHEPWDWKTAARAYNQREKQRHAIQPTIYCEALVKGGLQTEMEWRYPLDFNYGVMIRGAKSAKPQIVTVTRTQAHFSFAADRIRTYVDLALNFGLQKPWPRDDDHFLCNPTWCPWWSICKGARLPDAE
jgi:hypothetical protein